MGVGGQRHAPAALPPGKTRYTLYRLGGPQGRSGRVRKISSQPGFDPRTVYPIASRYPDWAIPAPLIIIIIITIIMPRLATFRHVTGSSAWQAPSVRHTVTMAAMLWASLSLLPQHVTRRELVIRKTMVWLTHTKVDSHLVLCVGKLLASSSSSSSVQEYQFALTLATLKLSLHTPVGTVY